MVSRWWLGQACLRVGVSGEVAVTAGARAHKAIAAANQVGTPTISQVLDGHVSLELECLDRIYLNAYVPRLQVGGQVVAFLVEHLGNPVPSPALFNPIRERFRAAVLRFAAANQIPVVHFEKDQRKAEVMGPLLEAAARAGQPRVVAVGVAQEFQRVFSGYDRGRVDGRPGPPRFAFEKADRRVTCFYFYLWDAEFGPGFIKLCSYFPYPAKVWVNGHEWAKQQARRAGIAFTELANGFAGCDQPQALQAICDALGPADIQAFFDRWLARIPTPLGDREQAAGYWWELSMRQIEVSRTLVLDTPARARAFFETSCKTISASADPTRSPSSLTGASALTPTPALPLGSSRAGSRSPSTASTSTRASSNTSRKAGRCGSSWSATPPGISAASVAWSTWMSFRPRPVQPTAGCWTLNEPVRAVSLRAQPLRGSHSPRARRDTAPERCASAIPGSWPWPAPCASPCTAWPGSPTGACVPG
jgi:hypothetical protein